MALTTSGALIFAKLIAGIYYSNANPLYNIYIGLSTTTPSADGSNFTEPDSDYGYRRKPLSYWGSYGTRTTGLVTASSESGVGTVTNDEEYIYFDEATSAWGTITHFGLFTSTSADTPFLYGALTSSVSVAANYVPLFRTDAFVVTIS